MPASAHIIVAPSFLEEFLETRLKGKGFSVGIDVHMVVAALGPQMASEAWAAADVKYALAALICKNEPEQQHFYELFDAFTEEKLKEAADKEALARRVLHGHLVQSSRSRGRYTLWAVWAGLAALALWAFCYPCFKADPIDAAALDVQLIPQKSHLATGDLISDTPLVRLPLTKKFASRQTLVQKIFDPRLDTAQLQISWDLDDTVLSAQQLADYTFKSPGRKELSIRMVTPGTTRVFKDTLLVCAASPDIIYDDPVYVNEPVAFTTNYSGDKPLIWTVNGKDTGTATNRLVYTFDSAGSYTLSCKYQGQQCTHPGQNEYQVDVALRPQFRVQRRESGTPLQQSGVALSGLWIALVVGSGLLALCGLLFYVVPYFRRWFEQKTAALFRPEGSAYLDGVSPPAFDGSRLPVDIRFYDRNALVRGKKELLRLASDLKKKIASDQYVLHLKQTIDASIRQWGIFTPVLRNRIRKRSYLVLIDERYARSPMTKLFGFLADELAAAQVDLDIYYYGKSPAQVYQKDKEPVDIGTLKDHCFQSGLLVFGDGYNFLDTLLPQIDAFLHQEYARWDSRVLVTPRPSLDWSLNEKLLAGFFHVVPADATGLSGISRLLTESSYAWKTDPGYHTYKVRFVDVESVNALGRYIDDEPVFQWLAALAVYPKISWEVMLALGAALDDNLLRYDNLLKLCRIEWIQQHSFPTRIRLELLKRLSPENEIKAREAIIALLEGDTMTGKDSLAGNDRTLQLIINKFVLYSKAPQKYPTYQKEEKVFLELYRNKRIGDIPLKVYLQGRDPDHREDKWENPLRKEDNQTDNLKAYYEDKVGIRSVELLKRRSRKALLRITQMSVIAFALLTLLGWLKPDLRLLTRRELLSPEEWKVTLVRDSCFAKFDPSTLMISANGSVILDTNIRDAGFVRLNNLKAVMGQDLEFRFLSDSFGTLSAYYRIDSLQQTISISGPGCSPLPGDPNDMPVEIHFYPESYQDSALLFAGKLEESGFSTTSHIAAQGSLPANNEVWYSRDEDKTKADSLRRILSAYCGQPVITKKSNKVLSRMLEIWMIGREQKRILWIDDHPENNVEAIRYFTEQHIRVDTSKTIKSALGLLNRNVYAYIITDIGRNNEEEGVTDRTRAGVEFTGIVNFPKQFIVVCSPDTTINNNRAALLRNGILSSNLNSDFSKLMPYITTNIDKGNTSLWRQPAFPARRSSIRQPVSTECLSSGSSEHYTLYFKAGETTFSERNLKLLRTLANDLEDNKSLRITVNSYSASGQKVAEQYGAAIKRYLDNKMVRLSGGLYKSYTTDYEDPNRNCTEKAEIIVQDIQGDLIYDTVSVNEKLGYKYTPVIGKEKEYYMRYDKYGITLTLNDYPDAGLKMASFHYEISNGKCAVQSGDMKVMGLNKATRIFDYCGIELKVILRDVNEGKMFKASSAVIDAIVISE